MSEVKQQIHLVSDSTGNTLNTLMAACLSQFDDVNVDIHSWPLTTSLEQVDSIVATVRENPGLILYTLADPEMMKRMEAKAKEAELTCFAVMTETLKVLGKFLAKDYRSRPGIKHLGDQNSLLRMEAVDYAMRFDDRQAAISEFVLADVIIVGPSRTSKTPTCIFLANKGIKAANIPFFGEKEFPKELAKMKEKLIIGFTAKPERLIDWRRSRLKVFDTFIETEYLSKEAVEGEIINARKFYAENGWPVIDVTNRSVEDVSDDIITMLKSRGYNLR
jgi:regulator of PEP synthase PpsR (kinase-PPPase family)